MKRTTRLNLPATKAARPVLLATAQKVRRHANGVTSSFRDKVVLFPSPVARDPQVFSEPSSATSTVPSERVYATGRDAFELYLREIGQTALLTPAEELALARRVQAGDEAAREHMIKANLRLVVKIAREYEGFGVPLLDLISEGNMGLIKGVERFDPDKGAKLSTYAAWWIKQNIRRALANQSKTVRLPAHVVEKRVQIRAVEARLLEVLGRLPTDGEVAEELGLEAGWVRHYRQALVTPNSLDAPLGNDDDSNVLADVVADPAALNPFEEASTVADNKLVREVLGTLNDREQHILSLRFGLDGDDERTLEDIGDRLGLTRERIRQIQERALQKLRVRIDQRESRELSAVG